MRKPCGLVNNVIVARSDRIWNTQDVCLDGYGWHFSIIKLSKQNRRRTNGNTILSILKCVACSHCSSHPFMAANHISRQFVSYTRISVSVSRSTRISITHTYKHWSRPRIDDMSVDIFDSFRFGAKQSKLSNIS